MEIRPNILLTALVQVLLVLAIRCGNAADLALSGPEELVASWENIDCETGAHHDFDQPPSAYRREDGTVLLLAGNSFNFKLEGRSLDTVSQTACAPLLESARRPEPDAFRDNEWLFAIRATGKNRATGFVHDEFHGGEHGLQNCEITSPQNFECWYGAITRVVSSDDAHSFQRPDAPLNVIAALPYRFQSGRKRGGVFAPKVVENTRSGKVFMLATFTDVSRRMGDRQCFLQARDSELTDWRAWDGRDFTADIGSPYSKDREKTDCVPVMKGNLASVKYIPDRDVFAGVGTNGVEFWYTFSTNLVNWEAPRSLKTSPRPSTWKPGDPPPEAYPSLLDPESSSRNFDTLDKRPYLYFVRYAVENGKVELRKRELLRIPIKIE